MPKYVLNPETLLYEEQEAPRYLHPVRIVVAVLAAAGFVLLYFWLYTSVFHWDLPRTAMLKRKAAAWEAKMEVLSNRLDLYDRTLTGIEQRDDEVYRSIYGLGEIPDAVKNSGLGGINRYAELDRLGTNSSLGWSVRRLDNLTKRVYIQGKALDEVGQLARSAGDMLACVPSVPPLLPDHRKVLLSSGFGLRTDPVFGGGEAHGGQDLATDSGTPVYATGDGVVTLAEFKTNGYGNQVVINHGYGYETRYAHLSVMTVVEGMTVKRGEQIGNVGTTGKSTGPHLHYEVVYRGNRVNPMNYMDFNMPLEEYRAMISTRKEESPKGRRTSTTELLRRSRRGNE
ncbi:MAG: M23 family metallopeptidase [Bacteroidales bacterium]|nr:M23 family metallopeptidase [Bacteroidales bacterium]